MPARCYVVPHLLASWMKMAKQRAAIKLAAGRLAPVAFWGIAVAVVLAAADDPEATHIITGPAAFHSYKDQKPGVFRKITVADLPAPYATRGVSNGPEVVPRPTDAWPEAPEGFKVELYADR